MAEAAATEAAATEEGAAEERRAATTRTAMVAGVAADAGADAGEAQPPGPTPPPPATPSAATTGSKPAGSRKKIVLLAIAVMALILLVVIVISVANALDDEPSGVAYTELKVGDCIERPPETLERAVLVDCAKPHDLEVFATPDDPAIRGAPYPGREILEREASISCLPQFEGYVGKPFDQSSLVFISYVPTEETWKNHDRRLLCTVSAKDDQPLQGPAKGSQL